MNIRKILVPVDFSPNSMCALRMATTIATQQEAEIHLLYIHDHDYDLFKTDKNLNPLALPDYMKALAQLTRSVINDQKVFCSYSSDSGSITNCILKTAIDLGISLIVIGKNGHTSTSSKYAGTHAYQVLEKSRIPVIVVPETDSKFLFSNVLFPVRSLSTMGDKLKVLRPLIFRRASQVTLLSLCDPDHESDVQNNQQIMEQTTMLLEKDKVRFTIEKCFKGDHFEDHVLDVINRYESQFDLLVITAETEKANKHFHIDNYTQKIIHQCNVPVLVVHPGFTETSKGNMLNISERQMVAG